VNITDFAADDAASITVLVAHEHALFRSGVREALAPDGSACVVAETGSALEIAPLAHRTRPDLLLLALELRGESVLPYLRRIRVQCGPIPSAILLEPSQLAGVEALLDSGPDAAVLTTIDLDDLAPALRAVAAGVRGQVFGPEHDELPAGFGLTRRELDTLVAVGNGLSNRAIAENLSVTEHTVKFHLTNVYRKLRLRSRTEATHWAVENGLVARAYMAA
jgi:DNA-binding NarL/FixJ family response regulator